MPLPFERLPKHIQERIRRDNPGAFRAVEAKIAKPVPLAALDGGKPLQKAGPCSVAIGIDLIVCSKREMDSDNLVGSLKPLRDAIATSIGWDDGDRRFKWNCHQVKTNAVEGVIVRIQAITD